MKVYDYTVGQKYNGGVSYLQYQHLGTDKGDIISGAEANDFINGGAGDDVIESGAGDDVLDGGTGSSFLVGGSGADSFFIDGRIPKPTWGTVTDWKTGEQLCLWGWRLGVSKASWVDVGGLAKYSGVTLHADLDGNGTIDASVTWSGLARTQLPTPNELDGLLWFR